MCDGDVILPVLQVAETTNRGSVRRRSYGPRRRVESDVVGDRLKERFVAPHLTTIDDEVLTEEVVVAVAEESHFRRPIGLRGVRRHADGDALGIPTDTAITEIQRGGDFHTDRSLCYRSKIIWHRSLRELVVFFNKYSLYL